MIAVIITLAGLGDKFSESERNTGDEWPESWIDTSGVMREEDVSASSIAFALERALD